MVDSYATYYLQCIKQLIGEEDSVERTDVSYEINCLSNKAVDQWNLLDVYSLIMLVDDVKQIPETLESSIIMYLDSLLMKTMVAINIQESFRFKIQLHQRIM